MVFEFRFGLALERRKKDKSVKEDNDKSNTVNDKDIKTRSLEIQSTIIEDLKVRMKKVENDIDLLRCIIWEDAP